MQYDIPEYFAPEIKFYYNKLNQKSQNEEHEEEDFKTFNEKRKNGENHNTICKMIQKDSIEEFIIYVNKNSYPLNSYIEESIFETNLFLLKQYNITLIQYAAFFGSVQIFKYLYKNGVELNESLWFFAIHGKNEEIFHILDDNKVFYSNPDFELHNHYEKCLVECIKCHHNDVANFIISNYISEQISDDFFASNSFHFYNFEYLPKQIHNDLFLYYGIKYDYFIIVKILFASKEINMKSEFISIF